MSSSPALTISEKDAKKVSLTLSAFTIKPAQHELEQVKIHTEKARGAITSIIKEKGKSAELLDWDTDQQSNAMKQRHVLLKEKKLVIGHYRDLQREVLLLQSEYHRLRNAFDAWCVQKERQIGDIDQQAVQMVIKLEEELHAHGHYRTMINIGYPSIEWKKSEIIHRLKRNAKELDEDVMWGSREVKLSKATRAQLYQNFLTDFKTELEKQTLAPLPVRIPGLVQCTASSQFLLPHILNLLGPSEAQLRNLELFPTLSLIYQAYNKFPLLEAYVSTSKELQFYLDDAWVMVEGLHWKDRNTSHEISNRAADRERMALLDRKRLTTEGFELAQLKDLDTKVKEASKPATTETVDASAAALNTQSDLAEELVEAARTQEEYEVVDATVVSNNPDPACVA